ncbi:MAG: hypothetical protein H0T78_01250 [Longispora sp.]|nr:hypothetical protein [Longispora sp. (in: high G+C Gram-positive bacteria)]
MIEVFYFEGCPHHEALVAHLRQLLNEVAVTESIQLRRIDSDVQARAQRFLGSPTVRIDGRDVEPGAETRTSYGLQCRLYLTGDGVRGTPPDEQILTALATRSS